MKLIATGDNHFDERSRFEECRRVHGWVAELVESERPDVVLLAGDVFERASAVAERHAVADFLTRIADVCPIVAVKGNHQHDRPGDAAFMRRLRTRHPITVEERAGVHHVAGAAIACVAYPDRATLAAAIGEAVGSEALDAIGQDALRSILRGLGDQLRAHDGPRILLSHIQCDGSQTSGGQELVGGDISVGLADLALASAELTLLGHVHLPQQWSIDDAPVVYVGCPYHRNFGEPERKSVVVAYFDEAGGRRFSGWERFETPCAPMVRLEAVWRDGSLDGLDAVEIPAGAEVRLRYRVPSDQRDAARADARRWAAEFEQAGASMVKLEEQLTVETRARAPEVALAKTLPDKLAALWVAKKFDPGERGVPLLIKLDELETAIPVAVTSQAQGACLESIRLRGFGPFVDHEVSLDLTALPGQLIAIHGPNGGGKSTVLGAFAAAMFRKHPTYGKLHKLARTRDAFLEVGLVTDARYRIRQTMDDVSRKGESLVLGEDKKPQFATTKTSAFDEWAALHLPTEKVFYSAPYLRQKDGGFAELEKGDRIAAVLRVLGTERLESLAEAARKRATAAKNEVATLETRIADERARGGNVTQAEAELGAARERVTEADQALTDARQALEDAKKQAEAFEAAERGCRETHAKRAQLRAAIDEQHTTIHDLAGRISNNRLVLKDREQIEAAVARAPELDEQLPKLREAVVEARRAVETTDAAIEWHERAWDEARKALRGLEKRAEQLLLRMKCQADIEQAVANLPRLRETLAVAEQARAAVDEAVETVRVQRLTGAKERIEGLRGGLEAIEWLNSTLDEAQQIAFDRLAEDNAAVALAAEKPQQLAEAVEAANAANETVRVAQKALTGTEHLAARADDIKAAGDELGGVQSEINTREAEAGNAKNALTDKRADRSPLVTALNDAEHACSEAQSERDDLTPLLKKAAPLAEAETRLELLTPQVTAAREALHGLEAELVASPEPPNPPAAPALAPLDSRVMDLEQAARNAHSAVAVTEQRLEDAKTAGERIAALREEQATMQDDLADWTRLADDLGRGGIQAMEVDAAGCELTETSNLLLHSCHGPRWSVRVDTQRLDAKGKRLIEDCEITVLDTESGREAPIEGFSGGEQVILGEALSLAMTALACRVNGIEGSVLIRDESGAALDVDNVPVYIRMLRKAAEQIGASRVLFVAHNPEAWALADARVEVRDGQITVAA